MVTTHVTQIIIIHTLKSIIICLCLQAVGDVFDLLTTLKLLCMRLWQNMVAGVDDLRLEVALKMLKSPHFNAKMNSLKEVCYALQTYYFFFFLNCSVVS